PINDPHAYCLSFIVIINDCLHYRIRSYREVSSLCRPRQRRRIGAKIGAIRATSFRSEEHTSELQSRENLVCRLLLEKKNTNIPKRGSCSNVRWPPMLKACGICGSQCSSRPTTESIGRVCWTKLRGTA